MSNYKSELSVEEEEADHHHQDTKPKMGRGKIQIKLIENQTNRQVTYSKRRNGIFKKARELTVLCDAKVSLIMISSNNKIHEYASPGTSTKDMIDMYQTTTGIDLWKTQYETMQQTFEQLKERNYKLRREIRQRLGLDLSDLDFSELKALEDSMASSSEAIRERKTQKIKTQTDTTKKKVKSLEERNTSLVHKIHAKYEDPPYGLVEDDGGYESAVALAGASNLYSFRHHHQSSHSALHSGGGSIITTSHSALHNGGGSYDSFDLRDLRLA
ncbi:MADS-box transcription factor [Trema orientale]|uniref:MADS-box transcription factor n=1 Tax=Trema orientale TaxID=63057 RepID=A0A2P5FNX9_TREOI|nr:MADS-box transcription factor [Trema orientale]